LINEPFAAGIIYPAVMSAWTFIAAIGSLNEINPQALQCAFGIFFIGLALTLIFMLWLVKTEIPNIKKKLEEIAKTDKKGLEKDSTKSELQLAQE
jgi:hypothetical protein